VGYRPAKTIDFTSRYPGSSSGAGWSAFRMVSPTRVSLTLTQDDRAAILVVRDNGEGFDTASRPDDGRPHFGLMLMRELAAEAGGVARVESAPGWGTKVVVEVPNT